MSFTTLLLLAAVIIMTYVIGYALADIYAEKRGWEYPNKPLRQCATMVSSILIIVFYTIWYCNR